MCLVLGSKNMCKMTNAYSLKLLLISMSVMVSKKKKPNPETLRIPHTPATYWFCKYTPFPFYKAMAVSVSLLKAQFKTQARGLRRHKIIPNKEAMVGMRKTKLMVITGNCMLTSLMKYAITPNSSSEFPHVVFSQKNLLNCSRISNT